MTPEERFQHFDEVVNPRLVDLARLICEASGIDDRVLEESRFQDMVFFYEDQVARGDWHPGLTETMADFTAVHDAPAALPYYRLALEQARSLELPVYTILVSMAQALFDTGQTEQAEACLRDGRAEALDHDDQEWVQKADEISREWSA